MKFLLLLLVVLVVVGVMAARGRRREPPPDTRRPPPGPGGAPMIACAHCGVHLPQQDALQDDRGRSYCGEEHRRLGGR